MTENHERKCRMFSAPSRAAAPENVVMTVIRPIGMGGKTARTGEQVHVSEFLALNLEHRKRAVRGAVSAEEAAKLEEKHHGKPLASEPPLMGRLLTALVEAQVGK